MKTDSVTVKKSKVEGKGVFATRNFRQGEVVLHWDTNQTVDEKDMDTMSEEDKKYISFVNGRYTRMQEPEKFLNHSCEPNTHVKDFCDVAIRDIAEGEEITSDYTDDLPSNTVMECTCGSKMCRGVIKR